MSVGVWTLCVAFLVQWCGWSDPHGWAKGGYEAVLWRDGPVLALRNSLAYCPSPSPPMNDALPPPPARIIRLNGTVTISVSGTLRVTECVSP